MNQWQGSIATQIHRFIGCWGVNAHQHLTQLISTDGWQVRSLSERSQGLSASGLVELDAWACVRDDALVLGREPFGRVPLYWREVEGRIWFSSHLKLLLPLAQNCVSLPALYGYSCFSYAPVPPVEEIEAIAAGTEQIWTAEKSVVVRHVVRRYEWRQAATQLTEKAIAIPQLQALLKDAVQGQIADLGSEPVGVMLSGGLDSSIVAALLVQAGVQVRAYTLDLGEYSETPYAEQVAEFLGIPLVKVEVTPKQVRGAIAATARALDLPYGDGVTVPFWLLLQAASQEVRVMFNGEGGDQLFAGWTNKPLIAAGVYGAYGSDGELRAQYLKTFRRLYGYEQQVFQPIAQAGMSDCSAADWLKEALDSEFAPSLLHRLRRATLMLKGAQNIHPRATHLGWAHGLQVRSPFCDLALAEWSFGVSGELHLLGACEKYILKRAIESWLPPEIVWRRKRGTGVPLTSWCFNELWREMGNWLNPGVLQAEGRWQADLGDRVVMGKLGGEIQGRRMGETLWLLIMWQMWRVEVLGEVPTGYRWYHPFWVPRQWRKRWRL
jgi:asparagine synthase (glutamine-hydrolysing)